MGRRNGRPQNAGSAEETVNGPAVLPYAGQSSKPEVHLAKYTRKAGLLILLASTVGCAGMWVRNLWTTEVWAVTKWNREATPEKSPGAVPEIILWGTSGDNRFSLSIHFVLTEHPGTRASRLFSVGSLVWTHIQSENPTRRKPSGGPSSLYDRTPLGVIATPIECVEAVWLMPPSTSEFTAHRVSVVLRYWQIACLLALLLLFTAGRSLLWRRAPRGFRLLPSKIGPAA